MWVREGTADHNNVYSCMTEDEYHLADVDLGSAVAVDVGAHIGGVSIGLAVDNPKAKVIAVECLSANVALLKENAAENEVSERVLVLHAAAAEPGKKQAKVKWNFGEGEAAEHHRFIANAQNIPHESAQTESVEALSLDRIVELAGGEIALLKIDCELCEYQFLDTPAVKDVREIRGEFHAGFERIEQLLGDTHSVRQASGSEGLGGFVAVRL